MTDLRNVWVYTVTRELIRADHIVSLLFDDQGVTPGGVRARVLGGFQQDTMRTVGLLDCSKDCGAGAVTELAALLGQAARRSEDAVFVQATGSEVGQQQWELFTQSAPAAAP